MMAASAPGEEKLNNQEAACLLKQRDGSESPPGACSLEQQPSSSAARVSDKNLYHPVKVKNINEKQQLKGACAEDTS